VEGHVQFHFRNRYQMSESNALVAVCKAPADVEASLQVLQQAEFDLQNVSLLGPGDHSLGDAVAYYRIPEGIGCWGKEGLFWTGVWSLLFGWAFVSLPDLGPILVAGPLATWIIGALDNAQLFIGLTAVGAGLYSIGISRTRALRYEAALKRRMYLLVVHGTAAEVSRAETILKDKRRNPTAVQLGVPRVGGDARSEGEDPV
jgi:hypothetical protein